MFRGPDGSFTHFLRCEPNIVNDEQVTHQHASKIFDSDDCEYASRKDKKHKHISQPMERAEDGSHHQTHSWCNFEGFQGTEGTKRSDKRVAVNTRHESDVSVRHQNKEQLQGQTKGQRQESQASSRSRAGTSVDA